MSLTGNLSRTERQDLLRMFELFDMEQKGTLSLLELKSILTQVSKEGTKRPALERVLTLPAFQSTQDRRLSQEEFLQLMTQPADGEEDEARRVFDLFDIDQKGYIDVADLRRIAEELGEVMGDAELQEMIRRATASPEGRVTLDDFEAVLNHPLMT